MENNVSFILPEKICYKIDWFSAMFKNVSFEDILTLFGMSSEVYASEFLKNEVQHMIGFDLWYYYTYEGVSLNSRYSFSGGDGKWFSEVLPDVRLDISGSGLDFLRSLGVEISNFRSSEKWFCKRTGELMEMHVTRCDFAFDLVNYQPTFLDDCIAHCKQYETVTGRVAVLNKGSGLVYSVRSGQEKTLYLGSKNSESMLRIYDKRLQYIDLSTGLYVKDNPYENPDSWIRIELQCRKKRADGLFFGTGDACSIFRYIYEKYTFSDMDSPAWARQPAKFWLRLFDWDKIPSIIQNINNIEFIPYKERVVTNFFRRELSNFLYTYTALGRDGFLQVVNSYLSKMQDFQSLPDEKEKLLYSRKYRNFLIRYNYLFADVPQEALTDGLRIVDDRLVFDL